MGALSKVWSALKPLKQHLAAGQSGVIGEIAELYANIETMAETIEYALYKNGLNPNLLQTTWTVDPQKVAATTSDNNSGLNDTTALQSKAELIRRIGSLNGPIQANMTIRFISDDVSTDLTDMAIDCVNFCCVVTAAQNGVAGFSLPVAHTLEASTAASNLNRTNALTGLQTITMGSESSGAFWTTYVGNIVFDSTVNSGNGAVAWVYADLGTKQGQMTAMKALQPSTPANPLVGGGPWGAPAFNPGATDNITIWRPLRMYTFLASGVRRGQQLFFQGFEFAANPDGGVTQLFQAGFYLCKFDFACYAAHCEIINCYGKATSLKADSDMGGSFFVYVESGCIGACTGSISFDGDVVVASYGGVGCPSFGNVCWAGNATIDGTIGGGSGVAQAFHYTTQIQWGPGTIAVSRAIFRNAGGVGTWASNFVNAGFITLDGATSAFARNEDAVIAAAPTATAVTSSYVALTGANMDAAYTGPGFHGHAYGPKGGQLVG